MITKSWHVDCFKTILLFDLGDAILPSRPHSNLAAVSSSGQGWPPFGGHPKGLSLTAVSTAASSTAAGGRSLPCRSHPTSGFRFPVSLQMAGREVGSAIEKRGNGAINFCAHA